jgi:tetratricopeptide (TPR) repeat protein
MVAALDAAQKAGGDFRGMQSAALLVLSGTPTGKVWQDRKIDIRVDDHRGPLRELRRLLRVHRAYDRMNDADRELEAGNMEKAMADYSAAERLFPGNEEMVFWHAATLVSLGRFHEAVPLFRKVFLKNPNWRKFSPDLVRLGILKMNADELERLLKL